MKKIICLWLVVAALLVSANAGEDVVPVETGKSDSVICDEKDQSSAEALLRAVFACQNSQRAEEIIDLLFLGTDVNDKLLGISETDELLVPNMLRDEIITIKSWRAEKLAAFSRLNEQALKQIELIEVASPSMHDQNPFQYRTDHTFEKALVRYAFIARDNNACMRINF